MVEEAIDPLPPEVVVVAEGARLEVATEAAAMAAAFLAAAAFSSFSFLDFLDENRPAIVVGIRVGYGPFVYV